MLSALTAQEQFTIPTSQPEIVLARKILDLIYPYHRGWHEQSTCSQGNCFSKHLNKLAKQIETNDVIEFVLPAFPAKSPNNNKTYGPLPDLGEKLSLAFLNELCEKIKQFYPRGAKIIICSDGRVFNDLVKVSDEAVNLYMQGINAIIQEENLTNITTFGLEQCYGAISYEAMRTQLTETYGEKLSSLKNKVKSIMTSKMLFNGIHRFIFEDHLSILQELSKNQIRNLTKETAYQVIQRSNAWSQLIENQFPHAVRLSIHPQYCNSEKLGIMLLKSEDAWATPWHRVTLFDGTKHRLVRKQEAEAMNATPIFMKDKFSHYALI